MRKSDKLKNFKKANLLAENRYLESKGFEVESYNEIDETPMDVNEVVDPKTEEIELKRVKNDLIPMIHNLLFHSKNPEGYLSIENQHSLGTKQITPRQLDIRHDNVIEILTEYIEKTLKTNKSGLNYDSAEYVKNWAHKEAPELDNIQGGELDEANAFDDYEQDYNEYEKIHYISPERKREIEDLSNEYELSAVKSEKGVGGYDPVKYFRLEFRKTTSREFGETDKHKYFWVNIIKDDVKISGRENLQSMIPDDTKRHEFMMDVKKLVNSILENELAQ